MTINSPLLNVPIIKVIINYISYIYVNKKTRKVPSDFIKPHV